MNEMNRINSILLFIFEILLFEMLISLADIGMILICSKIPVKNCNFHYLFTLFL